MTTNSGLQLAIGKLLDIPLTRMTSIGRELDYAGLRATGANGRAGLPMAGRDALAYALPNIMGMQPKEISASLTAIFELPLCDGRWIQDGDVQWMARRRLGTRAINIGKTFGDVVGQMIDGAFQQALGMDPACDVRISIDISGPHAKLHARDDRSEVSISFVQGDMTAEPLASRVTHFDQRLIGVLAEIVGTPLVPAPVEEPDMEMAGM
jgi:hypothetical protein